ncbi:MAG TPA: lamin tail domain-containing protein [Candidatus Eisenbacteria bacterium]|jgi:hypothetical protein|nr:lamin tail domain-containing protein [Candidatus Eisenbacteria bacterium]
MVRSWAIALWVLVLTVAIAVVAGMLRHEPVVKRAEAAPAVGMAVAPPIQLSEILAGPSRDWDGDGAFVARQDEWLEIRNRGVSVETLAGYLVSDADSTIRYAFSGSLAPSGVVLVTGRMAEDWQRAQGRTVSGLSLNNSGDTVRLFQIQGSDTVEVESKSYNSIEGATDRSTGRLGPGDTWVLFDGLNRYTGSGTPPGTGCNPTPGAVNDCPTATEETTWGKIKMRFR